MIRNQQSQVKAAGRGSLPTAFISHLAEQPVTRAMTAPATVDVKEPLSVLPGKLSAASVLVVVDQSRAPVGIVNANALLQYLAQHRHDDFKGRTVGQVMSTAFSALSADMTIGDAAEHLALAGNQYAAVVDTQQRLVGMLTPRLVLDLATAPTREPAGDTREPQLAAS